MPSAPAPVHRAFRHVDATVRAWLADRRNGVVPFYEGRFAASADRAGFAARNYYEGGQLAQIIEDYLNGDPPEMPERAVDIGCGYGRLTPHLCDSPHINSVHGIEPNERARERAADLYPFITFADGTVQAIPYPDDHFHLAVVWTVLQHVPDEDIEQAAGELRRVVAPGGYLVTCDKTAGSATAVVHPRPIDHYVAVLDGFELVDARERTIEPPDDRYGENTVLVFKRDEVAE